MKKANALANTLEKEIKRNQNMKKMEKEGENHGIVKKERRRICNQLDSHNCPSQTMRSLQEIALEKTMLRPHWSLF